MKRELGYYMVNYYSKIIVLEYCESLGGKYHFTGTYEGVILCCEESEIFEVIKKIEL